VKRKTAERSSQEFEAFVTETADPLFRSGYLMTANVAETEDLLQETFLRVARHWNRVRSMEYPLAYARRVLINLALDGAASRDRRGQELRNRRRSGPSRRPGIPSPTQRYRRSSGVQVGADCAANTSACRPDLALLG
jgi:DNA-directed RNA polymerase specialized sigma24 family protein